MRRAWLLSIVGFLFAATVLAEEAWKPPEQPKDDEHWYPERPVLKEPLPALSNGTFEEEAPAQAGQPPAPKDWAHPDGVTSFWRTAPDSPDHGKVIVLDTDVYEGEAKKHQAAMRKAAADGSEVPPAPAKTPVSDKDKYQAIGAKYGVSFYSANFACKPKQAYKISFDYKGPDDGAKVWVRGWGPLGKETRRRWETMVNCRTKGGGWRHFEQAFHPTRRPLSKTKVQYIEITYLQVMLYAYWPRGQYSFDNVRIEEISDEEYERLKEIPAAPQ